MNGAAISVYCFRQNVSPQLRGITWALINSLRLERRSEVGRAILCSGLNESCLNSKLKLSVWIHIGEWRF